MRKSITIYISCLLWMTALAVASCTDDGVIPQTSASVTVNLPSDIHQLKINSETLTFKNLSTGKSTTFNAKTGIKLTEGIYDCNYNASVTYTNGSDSDAVTVRGELNGLAENVVLTGDDKSLSLDTYLFAESNDFIFEEIFFTGTLRPSGSRYYGDDYVKIYNNTDHVLYADGLAFCESKFKSTAYSTYTPDIRSDTATVEAIYVVPGSGKDHPVLPGHSMIICDTGIDHRSANSNSFDLSAAGFEWYDVSLQPQYLDIDGPTVPNLDKWYSYSLSYFMLHNRGYTSFMLARIPVAKEKYLSDYYYTYDYVKYLPTGTYPSSDNAYKIANSWIVDGVNCSVESLRQWNVLPPSIDAGWTHCGKTADDATRFFKSIRRKMLYLNDDGTMKLKDTNNSSADFNTECVPSIIEQQHTSTDVQGDAASTVTYDGVQVKK